MKPRDKFSALWAWICYSGPSEVMVLADETANPQLVAAALLAQAEHGSGKEKVYFSL